MAEEKKEKQEEKEEKKEEKKEEAKEEKKEEKAEEKPAKENKEEEEEVEVPKKFEKLVKEIESLSVLDLAELVKILEKKFGVSATPQIVASAGAAAGGAGAEGGAPEKSSYNIELAGIGDKKIEVIKAVRDITQKGLKEAKDIVDGAASEAQVIKENVKKDEAEEIKKKLEEAGAKVELK